MSSEKLLEPIMTEETDSMAELTANVSPAEEEHDDACLYICW